MATFFNQATLSYNGGVINSNVVTGELLEVLSATKTALGGTYSAGDQVTYVISVTNTGTGAFTALTLTDNLGAYTFGDPAQTLYPLTYTDGSLLFYVDGVLQPTPTVTAGPPLTVTGINVPAGGNALIVYEAVANQFAPISEGGSITNVATVDGGGLSSPITATETVTADADTLLSISKAICPATVADNGQLTYTFVIENSGTEPADATDNAVVTDTFDPILDPISVTYNGTLWTEGVNYTYDASTGQFATLPGQITVPAATVTQDAVSGAFITTPGIAVLTVTGTV